MSFVVNCLTFGACLIIVRYRTIKGIMKLYLSIFSDAAKLRAKGNAYIVASLERAGVKGIVPSHGDVMVQLFVNGDCNMSDLARRVRRSKSTLTVLVDKLEKLGYVKKQPDPSDNRGVVVTLTEKGRMLEPVFNDISQGLNRLVSQNLSKEEVELLNKLLQKCVD